MKGVVCMIFGSNEGHAMLNLDPASLAPELEQQHQLVIVAKSLGVQLNTAISQIQNLDELARESLDSASAQEAIDTSFKALRRARVLIEILGDSLSTVH
jgi:hypothetical protein